MHAGAMKGLVFIVLVASLGHFVSSEVYHAKVHQDGDDQSCIILTEGPVRKFRGFRTESESELYIDIRSAIQPTADTFVHVDDHSKIIEMYSRKKSVIEAHMDALCKTRSSVPEPDSASPFNPEVIKIVDGGPLDNRIDVVFMGDGYTQDERQEFIDDITRLTEEMFEGVTFRSYLPVFNIWAIFVASVDSGIGYNGAKNTPFRLYRQGGQLRGIFTGNAQYARTVCAMTGSQGCDYPSLIGNDDYYGGLGGEFVISTRSNRTGTVVLRHEMGHNFVNVGEEYDNGQVYRGVNAATSVATLGWSHWLSGTRREERAMYRVLEYPWQNLGTGAWTHNFNSDGGYSSYYILVSVSAAGEADSLEFVLDGQVLPWASTGFEDREFYSWYGSTGFSLGQHTFSVRSKTTPGNPDIPRMICSVNIHEFGNSNEFVEDNNYVSAYPTWDVNRRKTFRPTNAGCLMRNMTHPEFCEVCREGMWYQFLQRISLIDSVGVDIAPGNPDGSRSVTIRTLPLAHFRQPGNEIPNEELQVRWTHNGVEQTEMRDRFQVNCLPGSWNVQVTLITPEVRSDPSGLLRDAINFNVTPQ